MVGCEQYGQPNRRGGRSRVRDLIGHLLLLSGHGAEIFCDFRFVSESCCICIILFSATVGLIFVPWLARRWPCSISLPTHVVGFGPWIRFGASSSSRATDLSAYAPCLALPLSSSRTACLTCWSELLRRLCVMLRTLRLGRVWDLACGSNG
jgi:hypothetical protein